MIKTSINVLNDFENICNELDLIGFSHCVVYDALIQNGFENDDEIDYIYDDLCMLIPQIELV